MKRQSAITAALARRHAGEEDLPGGEIPTMCPLTGHGPRSAEELEKADLAERSVKSALWREQAHWQGDWDESTRFGKRFGYLSIRDASTRQTQLINTK